MDDETTEAELVVELGQSTPFDTIRVQEYIALGQRIEEFFVDARIGGMWQELAAGTTIGVRRILKLPRTTAEAVRLRITCLGLGPLNFGLTKLELDGEIDESIATSADDHHVVRPTCNRHGV